MSNWRSSLSDFFIRNSEAGHLLEVFFVSAVSSIVAIRFFLKITGYPQLGGEGLHIAHMLWGGLLMLSALVLLLAFLSREVKSLSAIVGGIGFGIFIDELGKFLTSDNNYFFQPTIALIYILFILLFLAFRSIERYRKLTQREELVNVLEIIKDVVTHDLDREEWNQAWKYLEKRDKNEAVSAALRNLLLQIEDQPKPEIGLYTKIKKTFSKAYFELVNRIWFRAALIVIFVLASLTSFLIALYEVPLTANTSFSEWGHIIATIISGAFVVLGVFYLSRSRYSAYQMFKRSILVSIFLTQVFLFYRDQFGAMFGLIENLILLITLQYMIEQERRANRRALAENN